MRIPQGAARWRQYAAPRRVDLLIAGGLLIWGLPDVPWWWEHTGHRDTVPAILAALALTLIMSVPFCWRRRFPFLVLAAAASVLVVRDLLHHDPVSAFAAVLVAAYGVGSYGGASRRYARVLGWAALGGAVVVVLTSHGERLEGAPLALLGAAFVLGDAASARRAESAAAVEAAHQAERTRIARELHDVVAHQLSAIAVQAGAARMAAAAGPERVAGPVTDPATGTVLGPATSTVVGTVEQLAREALSELNYLLGALRREPDTRAAHPPAPTLAELDGLVAASRAAGIVVDLKVEGRARPVPSGVELSVYRIVQEALANVARHAPRSAAQVTLRYCPGELRVDVVNAAPAGGHRVAGGPRTLPGGRGGPRDAREGGTVRRPASRGRPAGWRVRGHGHHPLRQPHRPGAGMSGTGMSSAGMSRTRDIRVVVADDQALVRAGLATLLDSQPGLTVVGQAGDGDEAVRLAREAQPDVVLMDVRMPRLDGLAATRRIACEQPAGQTSHPARVVILTTYDLDEYVYAALRAGACGFLLKHAPPEELLLGVRAAADGGALLSPAVTKRLLAEFAARRPAIPATAALSGLTSREREVLGLVVLGWSNAEIAAQLVVTQSTVKTHVGHILDKLGLRDRVHAVVFGYEHGLAGPAQAHGPPRG